MKKLLLLLIIPFLSFGQGWIQTYEEVAPFFSVQMHSNNLIQQHSDGGYILTTSNGLMKIDENGNMQWVELDFIPRSVRTTNDGGYILVGENGLYKMDESLSIQWINDEISGKEVAQGSDNGYLIISITENAWLNKIIKTNSIGLIEWENTFQSTLEENIDVDWWTGAQLDWESVDQTINGDFIISGIDKNNGWGGVCPVMTINNAGEVLWYQSVLYEGCYAGFSTIQQVSDGGYILMGVTPCMGDASRLLISKLYFRSAFAESLVYRCIQGKYKIVKKNDVAGYQQQMATEYILRTCS